MKKSAGLVNSIQICRPGECPGKYLCLLHLKTYVHLQNPANGETTIVAQTTHILNLSINNLQQFFYEIMSWLDENPGPKW